MSQRNEDAGASAYPASTQGGAAKQVIIKDHERLGSLADYTTGTCMFFQEREVEKVSLDIQERGSESKVGLEGVYSDLDIVFFEGDRRTHESFEGSRIGCKVLSIGLIFNLEIIFREQVEPGRETTMNIVFDEGLSMRIVICHEFERRLRREVDTKFTGDEDHGEHCASRWCSSYR